MFNRRDYDFIRAVKADIMDNARIQSHDPQMIGIVRQVPVQLLHKVPCFHRHPRAFCQVMKIFDFGLWWLLYLYLLFSALANAVRVVFMRKAVLPSVEKRVVLADVVGLQFQQMVANAGFVDRGGNCIIQVKKSFYQLDRKYGPCIHFLRLLHWRDCFSVLPEAWRQIHLVRRSCGRDCTLHAIKAWTWLAYRRALQHAMPCRSLVFMCENDRWFFLMQTLKAHRVLLQHGILQKDPASLETITPYRNTEIEELHCYSPDEEAAFRHFIRKIGDVRYFTPRIVLKDIDKSVQTVLLICNVLFYSAIEEKVIRHVADGFPGCRIYVKPHPAHPFDVYRRLAKTCRIILVTDPYFYPRTDAVVAYHSSLASQYEEQGIVPIYHTDISERELWERLSTCLVR